MALLGGYLGPAAPLACVYNPLQLPLVFLLIAITPQRCCLVLGRSKFAGVKVMNPSNFNIPY
jgi:hypothetical protein